MKALFLWGPLLLCKKPRGLWPRCNYFFFFFAFFFAGICVPPGTYFSSLEWARKPLRARLPACSQCIAHDIAACRIVPQDKMCVLSSPQPVPASQDRHTSC